MAAVAAAALLALSGSPASLVVTLSPRHVTRATTATLSPELAASLEERIDEASLATASDVARFALGVTGAWLRFGLGHRTSVAFSAAKREANCVEYAQLFAAVFNRAAKRKHLAARASVIRSDARVFGMTLPSPSLRDHDWVIVEPHAAGQTRLFVDPTFDDLGLGWDISRGVAGAVPAR